MKGIVQLILKNPSGNINSILLLENMVMNKGLEFITSKLNDSNKKIKWCILGTDNTPPQPTQSSLISPDPSTFILITEKYNFQNKISFNTFYSTTEANGVWQEAGLMAEGEEENILFARITFPPLTKTNQQTLTIIWDLIFERR
ncbi:MAG: hypothetical protein NC833_03295 [Candidatus Omnitrophica bacterium]|nr:hypothetical protein [Candidatus Omnitrophota bacterium]